MFHATLIDNAMFMVNNVFLYTYYRLVTGYDRLVQCRVYCSDSAVRCWTYNVYPGSIFSKSKWKKEEKDNDCSLQNKSINICYDYGRNSDLSWY